MLLTKIYAIFFHSPYWKRIRYKIKKILDLEFRKTRFRTFARYCIWRVEGHFRSVCAWQSVATCEEEAVYSMGFRWVLVHHGGRVTRIIQKRASGGGGRVTGHLLIRRPSPCNQLTCGRIVLIPSPPLLSLNSTRQMTGEKVRNRKVTIPSHLLIFNLVIKLDRSRWGIDYSTVSFHESRFNCWLKREGVSFRRKNYSLRRVVFWYSENK